MGRSPQPESAHWRPPAQRGAERCCRPSDWNRRSASIAAGTKQPPGQNPSSFPPRPPAFHARQGAAMAFDGGSRRAGHGGAAAALAGGACSRMNPARSPVERGPSVRAHGASRRVEGRRPPRHEERRRLARRRPNKGASI